MSIWNIHLHLGLCSVTALGNLVQRSMILSGDRPVIVSFFHFFCSLFLLFWLLFVQLHPHDFLLLVE